MPFRSVGATEMTTHEDELYRLSLAAPFPPPQLMYRVSGLTSEADFAEHGRDLFSALSKASPRPLLDFQAVLDFGIGSGRLARMFKDFRGTYYGADVDHELLAWTASALPWVSACRRRQGNHFRVPPSNATASSLFQCFLT